MDPEDTEPSEISSYKADVLHDPFYMRHLKWADSQKQRGEWGVPGAAERRHEELLFHGYKASGMKDE